MLSAVAPHKIPLENMLVDTVHRVVRVLERVETDRRTTATLVRAVERLHYHLQRTITESFWGTLRNAGLSK